MGEFKAQILGIILVLSIFVLLNEMVPQFFSQIWANIVTRVNNVIIP